MASVSKREWTSPKGEAQSAWVVRYKEGAKHRSRQFERKKEADAFRQKVEREITDGTHIATSEQGTVGGICELFIRESEGRVADGERGATHHRQLRIVVDRHIVPALGATIFQTLEWSALERLDGVMRGKSLNVTTRRKYLKILRQVESFALKRRLVTRTPVAMFLQDYASGESRTVTSLTMKEVRHLLEVADVRPPGYRRFVHECLRCFVNLAVYCGLRYGEIAGLRTENVDLSRRVIRIRNSMTMLGELKGPKTRAGNRDVEMPEHVAAMMREWIERFQMRNPDGLVFTTGKGGRVQAPPFHYQSWRPLLRRAGLLPDDGEAPHFHGLRHFCASAWIALRMPLPEVARRLGHSKVGMTLRVYAHDLSGGGIQHEVADAMAGLLRASVTQEVRTDG